MCVCPYKDVGSENQHGNIERKTGIMRKRPEMLIRFHQKLPSPNQNILFVHSFHRLPLVCLLAYSLARSLTLLACLNV